MASETNLTPLNFNASAVSKSLLDKKKGFDIIFGYVTGLPLDYGDLLMYHSGFCLALEDKGIGQKALDMEHQQLIEDCQLEKIDVLFTKGDLPFDPRWFWIGDLNKVFELAMLGKLKLPISSFLLAEIYDELSRHMK